MHTRGYNGPERREEYKNKRKMVLTDDDVAAIAKIIESRHVCRYDVDPDDMRANYEFVKAFRDGAIETRRTFRTMMIRMFVWGTIAWFLALLESKFKWVRPLLRYVTGQG